MQLSKNFTLWEFTHSDTADRLGIKNNPTPEQIELMKKFCEAIVQPVRDGIKKPMVVTSGFRCRKLNTAISGSSNTSQHMYENKCAAVDLSLYQKGDTLEVKRKKNMVLFNYVKAQMNSGKLDIDQLIFERGDRRTGPDWVHIGWKSEGKNRHQVLFL